MPTAYEQALADIRSGKDALGASVPSYITDADTMSIANGNQTFLESSLEVIDNIPKFIGVSIISGANQLYNIPADIGNLISEDSFERSDTAEVIASLNSDLGAFYEEHQEGSDLAGFMLSSLIPGVGGVKLLNAGQKSLQATIATGRFGSGTSKALGLLAPNKKVFLDKALAEVVTNSSAAGLLQGNALKSMIAGFGQNALEVAAFETAVAVTMFNSPILENQDLGDFFSNIALGAGVFGLAGGAIDATKLSFALKGAADKEAVLARPWTFIESTAKTSDPYERLAINFSQLEDMPSILPNLEPGLVRSLTQAAQTKTEILQNKIRADIGELSGGDNEVANTLFQAFKGASANDQKSATIGLQAITKYGTQAAASKRISVLETRMAKGTATIKEIDELRDSAVHVSYAKIWGEDAGTVLPDAPKITSLSDTLKAGEKIAITPTGVIAGSKRYTFTTHFNTGMKTKIPGAARPWNIKTADALEANARYLWAGKLPAFSPTAKAPLIVHVDDFPLMEKVMTELVDTPGMEFVKFAGLKEGEIVGANFQNFLGRKKIEVANELLRARTKVDTTVVDAARGRLAKAEADEAAEAGARLSAELAETRRKRDLATAIKEGTVVSLSDSNNLTKLKAGLPERDLFVLGAMEKMVSRAAHRLAVAQASGKPIDIAGARELVQETFETVGEAASGLSSNAEGARDLLFNLIAKARIEAEAIPTLQLVTSKAGKEAPNKLRDLSKRTEAARREVEAADKIKSGLPVDAKTQEEIAAIINVKNSFLSGQQIRDPVSDYSIKDLLAMQDHTAAYREKLVKQGASREAIASFDTTGLAGMSQHLNLTYDTAPFKGVNNFVVENMVIIREQQKLYQQSSANAAAGVLREDYLRFEEITTGRVYSGAVPSGAGAKLLSAANGNYGSLAASVESIGRVTASVIDKAKARAAETFEPLLYKLANDSEGAVEFASLNSRIRGIEGEFGLNEGGTYLEPLANIRWRKLAKEAAEQGTPPPAAPRIPKDMPLRIDIKNQNARSLIKAHIEVNGSRTDELAALRTAQGTQFNRAPDAFYPIPVDATEFPFFAIVSDASVTSGNHKKMLYANSEAELRGMVSKLRDNKQLTFRFKEDIKEHHLAENTFQYEKSMNSNYLDTEVKRKGVSESFFVPTDPKKITGDFMKWHFQRETGLVREAVSAKYEVQFEELARLGKTDTSAATSTLASATDYAEEAIKNPFADYVKSALNIAKVADYPWWTRTNEIADRAVSTLLNKVSSLTYKAKTPAELAEVNRLLVQGGYRGGVYTEDMAVFANSGANRGALSNSIAKANALMATVILRMDPLNAANNAISSTVLLGAETAAIFRAVERGDREAVGALAELTRIKVPGTQETMLAPRKLISNSVLKFGTRTPEMQWYRDNGFITSISDQYNKAIDSLTFDPVKGVKSWDNDMDALHRNLKYLGDKGEYWTGNKLAEEFNRFVAADVMKQMSDVAVKRGLMSSKEQLAYINTFVNRTQGNYLAAQRPMLFQGPVGQSIGLFQTYQFNLIQQLLRHVGEGHTKDAMTLLGLQGTIHGMNGLPAFNAINTHLIGNASGNTEHKDAYSALYGAVGKDAGDWLMYGLASNASGLLDPALKVNLYTRGDINPRQVTIIPTAPADIPFIQATGKVIGNLFDTARQLNNGGDVVTTLLQGLENNGLSRPLAGLAQTLQGFNNPQQASYSTSNRGNVVGANDLASLTNLARITGGKPLDEAIALDATFRFKAYALKDVRRRSVLGKAIKSTMIGGKNPTQEQIEDFAASYVEGGGRQVEFNKWFGQLYKTANLSQANKIQQSLNSPFTQSMQRIMGGQQLRDFSAVTPEDPTNE